MEEPRKGKESTRVGWTAGGGGEESPRGEEEPRRPEGREKTKRRGNEGER